jgi:hypothetical protein
VAALAAAALVFAADVVMLGRPVSGAEAAAADIRELSALPEWRLRVGGYGAFLIPAFIVGVWQLYEGVRPAGARWAVPPFLLLSNFFAAGAVYHYLLAFAAASAKAQGAGDQALRAGWEGARGYLLVPFGVCVFSLTAGSLWFAAAVLFRRTHFPRWMALLSPALPVGAAVAVTWSLPAPAGGYLFPGAVHLATPVIFGTSTALLWNVGRGCSDPAARW